MTFSAIRYFAVHFVVLFTSIEWHRYYSTGWKMHGRPIRMLSAHLSAGQICPYAKHKASAWIQTGAKVGFLNGAEHDFEIF